MSQAYYCQSERAKKKWLLSLEGALFDVPFAALGEPDGEDTVFLVERHSIEIVPGALLLPNLHLPAKNGLFLGVGDPIYNATDPRWRESGWREAAWPESGQPGSQWKRSAAASGTPGQLVRLIASGDEVHTSAAIWRRQSGTASVLEGFEAGRDRFVEQLTHRPRVVHLATHVLFPSGSSATASETASGREQAFIAFSIPRTSWTEGPQYLTTSRISTLRVPGSLVVMTGCATGTGDALAGAGLLGLNRAWLMAGASGVLSTAWPVEDSPGELFSHFYRYFPRVPAAEALRRSQVELLDRLAPSVWASYQLTGGLR